MISPVFEIRFFDRDVPLSTPQKHDPEKTCPALDAGCEAVFRKDHAQTSAPTGSLIETCTFRLRVSVQLWT
jgi:hypothetical protein